MINSQFFIANYTGKQPLDLMQMPISFDDDAEKTAEYNRFIQSIDTIYASQNLDGNIPKFWTRRVQTLDSLGNVQFINQPHPESTLTSLASLSSYYFILRDSSDVPVKIPINGGEAVFSSAAALNPPVIDSVSSCTISGIGGCDQLVLIDNNTANITFNISNLVPYEAYTYQVMPIGGDWPVSVNPISGIIKSSKPSGSIDINTVFCPSTGLCGDNILNYSLNPECSVKNPNMLYTTLQLKVKPVSYNLEVYSDHFSIFCDDCLPKPIDATINPQYIKLNSQTKNAIEVSTVISGIIPHKLYSYSYRSLSSNWPLFVKNRTGIFMSTDDNYTIYSDMKFCENPSGACESNSNTLDYIFTDSEIYPNNYEANIVVDILPLECSESILATSNITRIECNDCIPCLDCLSVVVSGGPTLRLPLSCCSGINSAVINVSNGNKNHSYKYEFTTLSGSLSFIPSTGMLSINEQGNGTIATLASVDMVLHEQVLGQVVVTDINSGKTAINFIGFACGPGC